MDRIEGKFQYYGFADRLGPGQTPGQVRDDLAQQPGVRFVATFEGSCVVFAAAEYGTHEDAEAAIGAITDAVSLDWYRLAVPSRLDAPKRHSPDFCSIVRVQARAGDPARLVLEAIDDLFQERFDADPGHLRFSYGACVVEPYEADSDTRKPVDLLVDLGAISKAKAKSLAGELQAVRGVGSTWESNASLPGNAKRPPNPDPP
jgi:hypothetical protein